jgi:hypothetical protein
MRRWGGTRYGPGCTCDQIKARTGAEKFAEQVKQAIGGTGE